MDRITAVKVRGVEIPLGVDFPTSYKYRMTAQNKRVTHHVFVRVETENSFGLGEGTELDRFTGGTSRTMEEIITSQFSPLLLGLTLEEARRLFRRSILTYPHNPGAKLGLEAALLDLWAKGLGVPLYELLGGRMRTEIPICAFVGALPLERALAEARAALAAGFKTIKLKADGDAANDIARIRGLLELLPPGGLLRVDANQGWGNFQKAGVILREVGFDRRLEYIEQPVSRDRVQDLRKISDAFGVPVFADEAVETPRDAARLLEADLVDGICIKLAKCGSILDGALMARLAGLHGRPVTVVCAYAGSLGAAAELHLAAAAPIISSAMEIVPAMLKDDPGRPRLPHAPTLAVPEVPGLGAGAEIDF